MYIHPLSLGELYASTPQSRNESIEAKGSLAKCPLNTRNSQRKTNVGDEPPGLIIQTLNSKVSSLRIWLYNRGWSLRVI